MRGCPVKHSLAAHSINSGLERERVANNASRIFPTFRRVFAIRYG